MHSRFLLAAAIGLLLAPAARAQHDSPRERLLVVHCGGGLATPPEPPRANVTLVIRRGRIERVIPELVDASSIAGAEGADVQTIDLSDRFVMPGLIDAHTHLTSQYAADARLRRVQESEADAALRGVEYARKTLLAGFTTVRNVGSGGKEHWVACHRVVGGQLEGWTGA